MSGVFNAVVLFSDDVSELTRVASIAAASEISSRVAAALSPPFWNHCPAVFVAPVSAMVCETCGVTPAQPLVAIEDDGLHVWCLAHGANYCHVSPMEDGLMAFYDHRNLYA